MDILKAYEKEVSNLSNEQSAYIVGSVALIILGVLYKFIAFPFYWVSMAFFVYGLAVWVDDIANNMNSILYTKVFGALILLVATTFNLAFASMTVNHILELPSSAFIYTTTIISVILIPLSVSLVLVFIIFPLLPFAILSSVFSIKDFSAKNILMFKPFKSTGNISIIILFGRFISFIIVFSIALSFLNDNNWYIGKVEKFTKWFAYNLEMEEHSYCDMPEGSRVAYLKSDLIAIGTKTDTSYIFKITSCKKEFD